MSKYTGAAVWLRYYYGCDPKYTGIYFWYGRKYGSIVCGRVCYTWFGHRFDPTHDSHYAVYTLRAYDTYECSGGTVCCFCCKLHCISLEGCSIASISLCFCDVRYHLWFFGRKNCSTGRSGYRPKLNRESNTRIKH